MTAVKKIAQTRLTFSTILIGFETFQRHAVATGSLGVSFMSTSGPSKSGDSMDW